MTESKVRCLVEAIRKECAELLQEPLDSFYSGSTTGEVNLTQGLLANLDEHIPYLVAAVRIGEPHLFALYAAWANKKRQSHSSSVESSLRNEFALLSKLMIKPLPAKDVELMRTCIEAGIHALSRSEEVPSKQSDSLLGPMFRYTAALLEAKREEATQIVLQAVESGVPLKDIYLNIIQESQYEIGRLWLENKISVAQEHYCTAITQMIMAQLYPYLKSGRRNGKTIITTCVSDEQHEIGIRMVADMLELEGYDTYHVGANCPRSDLLGLIQSRKADAIAISATMAYHLPYVKQIISDIRDQGAGNNLKILVGGYPFNEVPMLWQRAGADGFAPDAASAVMEANRLLGVS